VPADLEQKLAVYMGDAAGFRKYSDPAAKNLRLGHGYFVRLAKAGTISKTGTPAPTDRPFSIPLSSGWNLIGAPFLSSVRWSDVKVQVAGQSTPITTTQAIQQGVLKAGLLTLGGSPYRDSSTLEPWTGYWVKATRSVTLLVPPPGSTANASQAPPPAWDPKRDAPPAVP
jgi:hypothetical protein